MDHNCFALKKSVKRLGCHAVIRASIVWTCLLTNPTNNCRKNYRLPLTKRKDSDKNKNSFHFIFHPKMRLLIFFLPLFLQNLFWPYKKNSLCTRWCFSFFLSFLFFSFFLLRRGYFIFYEYYLHEKKIIYPFNFVIFWPFSFSCQLKSR